MNIIDKRGRVRHKVGLGDIVVSRDTGNYYMVVKIEDSYHALSLNTYRVSADGFSTIDELIHDAIRVYEVFTPDEYELHITKK